LTDHSDAGRVAGANSRALRTIEILNFRGAGISDVPKLLSQQLLARLDRALAAHGRIVFLDHLRPFDDAAQLPALAHQRVRAKLEKTMPIIFREQHKAFEVIAFSKPIIRRRRT
jgi:hypothetical protein